jgi:hypothetical protein
MPMVTHKNTPLQAEQVAPQVAMVSRVHAMPEMIRRGEKQASCDALTYPFVWKQAVCEIEMHKLLDEIILWRAHRTACTYEEVHMSDA